ncbi:MAG: hypothetical protein KY475_13995, partial [Planctomycetes bacterium]|nr:hypothetical protein [Planctomycetota bacterium]
AWRRVDRLLADERASGVARKHQAEIVRLCEGFSIVSPYASFLVLENDAEYQRWKIERRNAVRVQGDRQAQERLRRELDRLREQAIAKLGPRPETADRSDAAPASTTDAAASPLPAASPSSTQFTSQPDSPTNRDLVITSSGGGGGGALDPLSGALALGLAGAAAAAARRRRERRRG